ncbi:MAG: hypothetical protein JWM20_287 [Patescibacteria group bacterium]|nr:hypothetical protein [Patescibacteria group bacterium]
MRIGSTITPELKVFDFHESLNFYTNIAGFKILYSRPEEDFAMLEISGARLMIEGLSDKSRTWKVASLEKPLGRGMHFQIQVEDVDALYKKFKDNSYAIFHEMEDKWYRKNDQEVGNRQFLVQDPDGYLLRFFGDLGTRKIGL